MDKAPEAKTDYPFCDFAGQRLEGPATQAGWLEC